jgi:foldase protein PrsA
LHVGAGTVVAGLLSTIVFQFLRAEPAASQTRAPQGQSAAAHDAAAAATTQYLGRVNNQPITYDQVARECVARHGAEVLDSLINRLIIQQECTKRGIVISEAEVLQEVQSISKKFNLPQDAWYQMLKTERNITPEQYHRDIIWPMLALKKLAGQEIQVTEEDMRKAFERDYGPRAEVRVIFVDGNIRQASEIWDLCQQSPGDFDKLAREHSSDPNSRPLGGVVPPIRRHGGLKQVEEAAFKLKPGEISGVIQVGQPGDNRYVILKCEGFTTPVVAEIQDVWSELHATLVEEKTQETVASVFEDLRTSAQVVNYLTNESTLGPRPGQVSSGGIQQTSASGRASVNGNVTPAGR